MAADSGLLEEALGHTFKNREILERALTHRSRAYEQGASPSSLDHNEQLEFFGDAVLSFLISEALITRYANLAEGRLSKMRAQLVSARHLYFAAQKLNLGRHLELGRGEELQGGREKCTLLADALEAVIAAAYLDGGMEAARRVVEQWILGTADLKELAETPLGIDFKTALQECARARKLPDPRYVTVGETGPAHARTFTIEVRVGPAYTAQATGSSKKAAAQKAAKQVYGMLEQEAPVVAAGPSASRITPSG
jgi:ribonuclease-3